MIENSLTPKFPWLTFILCLIIVALVSGGGVYFWQLFEINKLQNQQLKEAQRVIDSTKNNTKPTQIVTKTPSSETQNWKNYTSTDFGFSINIPSEVKVDRLTNDKYNRAVSFEDNRGGFVVMLRTIYEGFDLNKYYYMDMEPDHKVLLDGVEANVYIASNGYCDGPGCSKPYISFVTVNGNNIYHFSFHNRTTITDIDKKILDSFKFTN